MAAAAERAAWQQPVELSLNIHAARQPAAWVLKRLNSSRECPGQEQQSGRNRRQRAEAEEGRKNIRSQRREAAGLGGYQNFEEARQW